MKIRKKQTWTDNELKLEALKYNTGEEEKRDRWLFEKKQKKENFFLLSKIFTQNSLE